MSSLRQRLVLWAFALPFAVALGRAQAPAADAPRTAAVLDVLRSIPTEHFHLYATPLGEKRNAHGCAVIAPRLAGVCGTGWRQAFHPELARRLARELFAAYRLAPAGDQPAPGGVTARLDCFDAAARVGLKLRGRVERSEIAGTGAAWPRVVGEAADTDLDVAELQQLTAAGCRIHVADVETFFAVHSADTLTATLAYLASVCGFLNGITDGEDVDLSVCLAPRAMWIAVPPVHPQPGVTVSGSRNVQVDAERPATLSLAIDPKNARALPAAAEGKAPHGVLPEPLKTPYGNAGRPTVLHVFGLASADGGHTLALKQRGADGVERALCTGKGNVLVVPGTFDSKRPFVLELRLEPGRHWIGERVWIAAPGR